MALINNLEEIQKNTSSIHKPVSRATVSIIDGHKMNVVQIDSFGSPERVNGNKPNQVIQLDRNSAGLLLEVIHRAFPDLK